MMHNDSFLVPTNMNNCPPNATHWAPETDEYLESWYRYQDGLWYSVNDYWASDIAERPHGFPAQGWNNNGKPLKRPLSDLIDLKTLKD